MADHDLVDSILAEVEDMHFTQDELNINIEDILAETNDEDFDSIDESSIEKILQESVTSTPKKLSKKEYEENCI